jgi:AcrR family transcriptional regulator
MAIHEDIRGGIIEAARGLFAEQGAHKTTLDDIARRMHRTKSFIYHYFKDKDDLLGALIGQEGDEYQERLRAVVEGETPAKEKLRAYVLTRFRIFDKLGTFYKALRENYFEQYPFIEAARRKYDIFESESVGAILAEGVESGELAVPDRELVTHAFLIALKGFEMEWATGEARSFEKNIDALMAIFFDGIATRGTPRTPGGARRKKLRVPGTPGNARKQKLRVPGDAG